MSQGLAARRKALESFNLAKRAQSKIPRFLHQTSTVFLQGFMTVAEVAKHLGVSRSTVYQLCARGKLGHVRVSNAIRISRAAVLSFAGHASSRRGG